MVNNNKCFNKLCPKYNKGVRCKGCYIKLNAGYNDDVNEDIFMYNFMNNELI